MQIAGWLCRAGSHASGESTHRCCTIDASEPARTPVRSSPMANSFFTIGHSTRSIAELADLLQSSGIRTVVDVRTMPRSRTNPQFNFDVLPASLATFQIGYEHIAELGGLRGKQRDPEESPNLFWKNRSFRNYADYALTERFRSGFDRLCALGAEHRCAIMCAEAVWWRCHRRIIADYLMAAGESVFHILGAGHVEAARPTPSAEHRPGPTVVYPPASSQMDSQGSRSSDVAGP